MAAYRVIRDFEDSNPNSADAAGALHIYRAGDDYPFQPYQGAQVADRIAQLTAEDGPNEAFDGPVIKEIEE